MLYSYDSLTTLVNALNSSGITKTIYFQDTTYLIFSAPAYSNKVIKISTGPSISIGDAWTSGSTITNQITFAATSGSLTGGSALIITPNILAISTLSTSTTYCQYGVFGKLASGDFIVIPSTGSGPVSTMLCKNTTQGKDYIPVKYVSLPIQTTDSFYLEQDIRFKDAGNVLDTNSLVGAKWLSKTNSSVNTNTYGNDIGFLFNYHGSPSTFAYSTEILIKNGAI